MSSVLDRDFRQGKQPKKLIRTAKNGDQQETEPSPPRNNLNQEEYGEEEPDLDQMEMEYDEEEGSMSRWTS